MKKIKEDQVVWGVIGAGDVCEKKSAPAMNKIKNSRIGAVMSRNKMRIKDYAQRHGIDTWYTDLDAILSDKDVNAIYISTPPSSHLELALKAAEAGKPLYIEKPMARTYAECQKMATAFKESGLPLYVAYYRRTLPHFLKVKAVIKSGAIGEVRTVEIIMHKSIDTETVAKTAEPWRVNPEISGGGLFHDLASHQLDLLDFLIGPIQEAHGFSLNQSDAYQADDMTSGVFQFANGITGVGNWCFNTNISVEQDLITIVGSKGKISFAAFGSSDINITTENGTETFQFKMPEHIQQYLIEQVVSDLLGEGECVSTGESGARANWVMDKILGKV